MEHELKIVMKFHTEGIDCDQNTPILSSSIRVSIDDHIIGCIQHMTLDVDTKDVVPQLEFTFPDLHNLDYDLTALPKGSCFTEEVDCYIEQLKLASNVIVKTASIDDGNSNVIKLDEVGTDGYIDSYPMQRRNK